MSRPWLIVLLTLATIITTEVIFHLSHFRYGIGSVFSQPFDLVNFTIKLIWWLAVWFFYRWIFSKLSRRRAGANGHRETT